LNISINFFSSSHYQQWHCRTHWGTIKKSSTASIQNTNKTPGRYSRAVRFLSRFFANLPCDLHLNKLFFPLTGMPLQSFDSVTIDTDLDTVCSEQVRQHLKSTLSNRPGTGTILTYVCQKSCVLFVCWMHVQLYWCYNAFSFCIPVTHFAKYANSDQEYNPKYGMLSYFIDTLLHCYENKWWNISINLWYLLKV